MNTSPGDPGLFYMEVKMMFEINLCCPECGCFIWDRDPDDQEKQEKFICDECGHVCTMEQMQALIFK